MFMSSSSKLSVFTEKTKTMNWLVKISASSVNFYSGFFSWKKELDMATFIRTQLSAGLAD